MERMTFRLPHDDRERIERLVDVRGEYPNYSEAIRTYVAAGLDEDFRGEDR